MILSYHSTVDFVQIIMLYHDINILCHTLQACNLMNYPPMTCLKVLVNIVLHNSAIRLPPSILLFCSLGSKF